MMRARKSARKRRDSSPCQYICAVQSALITMRLNAVACRFTMKHRARGFPQMSIVILIQHATTAAAQVVETLVEALADIDDLGVIVTSSAEAFFKICACE